MIRIVCFVVLAVCTLCCHRFIDQYETIGADLLTNDWQIIGNGKQSVRVLDDGFCLVSISAEKSVSIKQELKTFKPGSKLKLSSFIRFDDVVQGAKSWNRARLLLLQNDGIKDRWDLCHSVASLKGSGDWGCYEAVFPIAAFAKKVTVVAQLSRCSGSFELKDIQLIPVKQTWAYTWAARCLLGAWGCFAVIFLWNCLSAVRFQNGLKIIAVGLFILILIGTCMPIEIKKDVSQTIVTYVNQAAHSMEAYLPRDYSKIGHFLLFSLLGITMAGLTGHFSFGAVFLNILMVASGTELAQFFIEGRSPLIKDFLLDACGGSIGVSLFYFRRSWK